MVICNHVTFIDIKICPLVFYGAEFWDMGRFLKLEQVQYYACKRYMCCKQTVSSVTVLGDYRTYHMYTY